VRRFIDGQDSRTRIGLVVFAGFAQVAVAPTTNHDELLSAVDSLTTGRGTTIGAAILKSIDAIAEINPDVAPADNSADTDSQGATPLPPPSAPPTTPSSPGGGANSTNKAPEIVVLLTDGANTRGITPEAAAKQAAARGVRVFPIGFGTTEPTQMVCTAEQLGGTGFDAPGRGFGGGFGPGSRNFLIVDEEALRTVASTTGGEYFKAQDADQLDGVLRDLPKHVDVQKRDVEVSVIFAGLAALLLVGGLWLAGRWSGTGT
jgi:Ca-activated chloride channel family protein